ncbi:hypothetical protein QBC47DRAFT_371865 [Echria macrotheca]|uniref:G-patch domain-containing protein n=1 Tax=Echria macrotheca TaxID=438768 RepID=A0AAJ0BK42_9PEZI|nr:hypothetical protein QBC47DRAFT_371865 [Echria macrotheca]
MASEGEDDYDSTPLQNLRPFGSGLFKRKVAFVPASGDNPSSSTDSSKNPAQDVADIYLSMVLPRDARDSSPKPTAPKPPLEKQTQPAAVEADQLCEICKLPLTSLVPDESTSKLHEHSLAHQLCLPHSHPPSALDRSRMGLAYLSSYGWDPDARRGLGNEGQGIQYPVKSKVKRDNLGVGMVVPRTTSPGTEEKRKNEGKLLDAGKVRKMAAEEKKKAERLRRMLSGAPDLEKYLGPGVDG